MIEFSWVGHWSVLRLRRRQSDGVRSGMRSGVRSGRGTLGIQKPKTNFYLQAIAYQTLGYGREKRGESSGIDFTGRGLECREKNMKICTEVKDIN